MSRSSSTQLGGLGPDQADRCRPSAALLRAVLLSLWLTTGGLVAWAWIAAAPRS